MSADEGFMAFPETGSNKKVRYVPLKPIKGWRACDHKSAADLKRLEGFMDHKSAADLNCLEQDERRRP